MQPKKLKKEESVENPNIFQVKNKQEKKNMFKATIPNWAEKKKLDIDSEKIQKCHHSLFEWLVIDMFPSSTVTHTGFLRFTGQAEANLGSEVGSTPVLCSTQRQKKIQSSLRDVLVLDSPEFVSFAMDG